METIYDLARRFRFALLILTLILWCVGAFAFWPCDMVPHGPIIPDPEPPPEISKVER